MDNREAIRLALLRLADNADSEASWTESNFLPGPNSGYAIRHYQEMAEYLREEANDPDIWVPKEEEEA